MSHNREPRGGGIELLIHRRTQIELGPGVSGAPQRRMCELDHDDAGQSGVTSHHSQAIDVSDEDGNEQDLYGGQTRAPGDRRRHHAHDSALLGIHAAGAAPE